MPDISGITYSVSCDSRTGVKELYLFKTTEVSAITADATSREVTAITMISTKKGYKVEIDDNEASYDGAGIGSFGSRMTQSIVIPIYKLDAATKEIVQNWISNSCLGCIVRLYNGNDILLSYDFDQEDSNDVFKPLRKLNSAFSMGSGLVADAGETATPKMLTTMQWTSNYLPPFVDSTFDYATFTTAAA